MTILKNFLVSNLGITKIEKNNSFYACQYTASLCNEDISDRNIVADFKRKDRESMQEAVDFVQLKYEKYLPILSERLNRINNINYSETFWRRCLSMGIIMQITLHHDVFEKCERLFNPKKYTCNILSVDSYITPRDYEEHREIFECSLIGQEQLLSCYMDKFYSGKYEQKSYKNKRVSEHKGIRLIIVTIALNIIKVIRSAIRKINSLKLNKNKIKVIICGSFFSRELMGHLMVRAPKLITELSVGNCRNQTFKVDINKRTVISAEGDNFDKFDKYFFSTLLHTFPASFVETFSDLKLDLDSQLKSYCNLKYFVSEAWLSNTWINLIRALAYEDRKILHIYNEHNCIFHPFMGNMVKNQKKIVDTYVTFGWEPNKSEGYIKGASLYPFKGKKVNSIEAKILYVSYPVVAKMPNYGGAYATGEYGAIKHLEFVKTFFENVENEILGRMTYRPYPKDSYLVGMTYDKEIYLKDKLRYVNVVKSSKNFGIKCKDHIASSQLVVIDFLSTAYLEALMMNIPTICFFDPTSMYLERDYSDFYDLLIESKIMHTSPESAANHLKEVYMHPNTWWQSELTQEKKNKWLRNNFGPKVKMVDYVLSLTS